MAGGASSAEIVFYYGSGSPYAWKVWLALEHKGLRYQARRMSFDGGDLEKPDYAAINPRRKVPAIVDGGFALYESAAIVEYLADKYRNRGAPLWPEDVQARAIARRVAAEVDAYVLPEMNKLIEAVLYAPDGKPDPQAVEAAAKGVDGELAFMERALAGDFVVGVAPCAADYALYPVLAFTRRMDKRRPGFGLVARVPARLRAWMERIEALPYFAATYPPHWKE